MRNTSPYRGRPHRISALVLVVAASMSVVGLHAGQLESPAWVGNQASQLIFLAVLEGLYRDGPSNDDIDLMIPPSKDGGLPRFNDHFVYACPLCHPAYEALRLYRMRPRFYGLKGGADRFGPGLPPEVRAQLRSDDAELRRGAIQSLIEKWVSARLDLMRLSESERADITAQMEEGRKSGMEMLKRLPNIDRDKCPICEGGVAGCQIRRRRS